MARKRFVSPKFYTHAELYDAEVSSGLPLRIGYQGLWGQADRRGLFAWKPRELKLQILPFDPVDFGAVLDALERFGFVRSYMAGGKRYGYIASLKYHQSFHRDEKPDPTIPDPPPGAFDDPPSVSDDLDTAPAPLEHGAGTVLAPPQHGACSTVAVAVAVTGTTTTPVARTTGVLAPCEPDAPVVDPAPGLTLHTTEPPAVAALAPPTDEPPVPLAEIYLPRYRELCGAAMPYERAALDALLAGSPLPDVVFGAIDAVVTGQHPIRSDKGVAADMRHVLMAVCESAVKFFANGKAFDIRLFNGCVRSVVNRKPEPTPADERAAEAELRKAAPHLQIESPRTPEEQAAAKRRVNASMRKFYLEAGNTAKAAQYVDPPEPTEDAA